MQENIPKDKREYIMNELMKKGFIVHKSNEMLLLETEESGASELNVYLTSEDNLWIENVDKQKTELLFFQTGKSLYKRVDHMIYSRQKDNKWKLYLIEMKSCVGDKTWQDVKGKFRASYLLGLAIAGMLELSISETVMYTTFEKVLLKPPETMPSARRLPSGRNMVRMEDEWNGGRLCLNFGERVPFVHIPIQMNRINDMLVGSLEELRKAE